MNKAHSKPKIEAVSLPDLHPAPRNPRTISDERFQNLCRSIEADPEFLWRRPVLAQTNGDIYAGNMRYRAAEHLGMETIPAIVEDVSDQLAKERAMRDNAQWGEWEEDDLAALLRHLREEGSDLELLGFEERDLQQLLDRLEKENAGLTDADDIPDPPEEAITKPGDLWLLGDHRVLCGDSTNPDDVARLMDGKKAELMATDPPYLVDYKGSERTVGEHWDDFTDAESSVEFFASFLRAAQPHLQIHAPIYQWHAHRRQALVEQAWKEAGLLVHQQIIWVKSRGVLTRSHFMWQHEPCFYGWSEGKMPKLKPAPSETTVWQVDQKGERDGIHPTQKPVELFRRPLKFHTKEGDLCYEPFLGSGTCLIAAEELNRRCYGMEQEPRYVDVVVERWESFTGEKAVQS